MKEFTQFEEHTVEIWRRPRQRHMHLTVNSQGRIRITCHKRLPRREIAAFLLKSADFIRNRFKEIQLLRVQHPPKQYLSGEFFWWLGEKRALVVNWVKEDAVRVSLSERVFEMRAPLTSSLADRREAMRALYVRQARELFAERLRYWSGLMNLQPKRLSVRGQSTRWGSCSSSGEISLNWLLMSVPRTTLDYVIIHELAHLRHMNHSPAFWNLVGSYAADFSEQRLWLRKNERVLKLESP